MDLEWYFYAITAAIFLILGMTTRRWRLAALLANVFFILAVTILSRRPTDSNHFQATPFWSWSIPNLWGQILMNIIDFIPLGLLGASLWKWKIIPAAAALSLTVELIQLITKTGLFETDDIIHNTLGAALGYGIFTLITAVLKRKKKDGQNGRICQDHPDPPHSCKGKEDLC